MDPESMKEVLAAAAHERRVCREEEVKPLLAALKLAWDWIGYKASDRPAKVDLAIIEAIAAAEGKVGSEIPHRTEPSRLVVYCPGDAPGSPACMEYEEAKNLLIRNSEYCAMMERATGKKYQLPHIGGDCEACGRLHAGLPKRG